MTLMPRNLGKRYSPDEIDKMTELAGTHSLQSIAKKLGRPVPGLRAKMMELGIGSMHEESGTYTASALAEIVGVSHETVRRWILKNELPASKKARKQGTKRENMLYYIYPEDFWEWASDHRELVLFNRIERNELPPEPDWVEEERRKQFYQQPKQKLWTPEEDERLLRYFYEQALRQREVAALLNRSLSSVEKRLMRLRKN